jgi:hypothetical protein
LFFSLKIKWNLCFFFIKLNKNWRLNSKIFQVSFALKFFFGKSLIKKRILKIEIESLNLKVLLTKKRTGSFNKKSIYNAHSWRRNPCQPPFYQHFFTATLFFASSFLHLWSFYLHYFFLFFSAELFFERF